MRKNQNSKDKPQQPEKGNPQEVKPLTLKELKARLNIQQAHFCEIYTSDTEVIGNGCRSYAIAYGLDMSIESQYENAKSSASELLTNPNIYNYINALLDAGGFNDMNADKQIAFLMNQQEDKRAKVSAIHEYNLIRNRVNRLVLTNPDGKGLFEGLKDLSDEEIIRRMKEITERAKGDK